MQETLVEREIRGLFQCRGIGLNRVICRCEVAWLNDILKIRRDDWYILHTMLFWHPNKKRISLPKNGIVWDLRSDYKR